MPTCGNCGKPVGTSDVTCAHCGVLLAAYASPDGAGAYGTYEEPAPPPPTEIPSVDMDVKPPSEKDVVTDPNEVAEEPISTAPRPLFDTYLTVDEIARAAESDHADDVVMITDKKIKTKRVEFEVPDYAKPPKDAAPIPTIDEDDDSVVVITQNDTLTDSDGMEEPNSAGNQQPHVSAPTTPRESWLHTASQATRQSTSVDTTQPNPAPKSTRRSRPTKSAPPAGTTDEYLRKLHAEVDYIADTDAISKPVQEKRISPAERNRNRNKAFSSGPDPKSAAEDKSTKIGCSTLYFLVVAVLWFATITTVLNGNFSLVLIFVTMAATWGLGPVRKNINEMR